MSWSLGKNILSRFEKLLWYSGSFPDVEVEEISKFMVMLKSNFNQVEKLALNFTWWLFFLYVKCNIYLKKTQKHAHLSWLMIMCHVCTCVRCYLKSTSLDIILVFRFLFLMAVLGVLVALSVLLEIISAISVSPPQKANLTRTESE